MTLRPTHLTLGLALSALLMLGVAAIPQAAEAQAFEEPRGATGAYYNFARQSDVTIRVHVWGALGNAGLYELPRETRLSTLFSLAGGPPGSIAPLERRRLEVRLLRPAGDGYEQVFTSTMNDGIVAFNTDPVLQSGDVLTVEEYSRRVFSWRDATALISAAGTVALVLERVLR
jgi:hypothetical protein